MFDRSVALPPGLEISANRRAIEFMEERLSEQLFIDLYVEQANLFSGIVSSTSITAMNDVSNYEKHRHSDTAQQRFPDLRRRGAAEPLRPDDSLECKASMRPWAIQFHFDHAGWYIVWRCLVDRTATIRPGRQLVIWRVDVAFLTRDDWKYEKSRAGSAGGGRTHTFGVKRPATRLRGCAVYALPGIAIRSGKPVPVNGDESNTNP